MASDDLLAPLDSRRVTDADHRLLVESIADYAIFLLDPGDVIMSWNRGAQKMKGYEASAVVGRHIAVFYPQDLLDRHWPDHALKMARETGIFKDEGWRLRKDGTRFWAHIVITRITGPHGELIGFSKITRDLTERRRITALEDEGRRITNFLALLGHELRNPWRPSPTP